VTSALDIEHLFARAQAGDARSLEQLLRLQRSQVVRYAMRLCISPEDAEDAAQEALIALARYVVALRRVAALSSWLFAAVRTHCTRLARRALRRRFSSDIEALSSERPGPEDLFVDEQLRLRLAAIIADIEPPLREVLVRRDVLGQSSDEVAHGLGITREAMKSRLHRARADVKRRLLAELARPQTRPTG
jgi:RNA polymerase sigma factor (sigma-70 family)